MELNNGLERKKKGLWLLATILIAVCATVYTFSYLATTPWNCIIDLGGDCIKNVFTYLYHSMYGRGYWFGGMNYPYGEHIIFTDGLPLFSVFFATFHNITPEVGLTVMWWGIALSFVISIVYIYLLLLKFSLKPLSAMLFAVLIGLFSPQLLRILGHYSLSFSCIIPMMFYWTYQYHTTYLKKYLIYIFILGLLFVYLHPYFGPMLLLWVCTYALGYFIYIKDSLKNKIKHTAPFVTAIFLLIIIFRLSVALTDPLKDRPTVPDALRDNRTNIWLVVSSVHSPIWNYLKENKWIGPHREYGEGYSYLGLVSIFVIIISLFIGIYKKYKKDNTALIIQENKFSRIWIFIAIFTMLISMGAPFVWNMEWLMDYISVFRQFRSPGRFSWIFYYVMTVYTAVVINTWFTKQISKQRYFAGYTLLIVTIGIWCFEASGYTQYTRTLADRGKYFYDVVFSKNQQTWESFLKDHNYKKDDFQGIFLVGKINVGTEKLCVGENRMWLMSMAITTSLQLHLPIVDQNLGRSSWGVARKQLKMAAGPYVEKPLLHDIKSDKPFLLLRLDEDELSENDQYLFQAADFIGNKYGCKVYSYSPRKQLQNDNYWKDFISKTLPTTAIGDTVIGNRNNVYIEHFDNGGFSNPLFGKGALPYTQTNDSILAIIPIASGSEDKLFEYSTWCLIDSNDCLMPYMELTFLDGDNKVIVNRDVLSKNSVDNNGLWCRATFEFKMPVNCRKIISCLRSKSTKSYRAIDELVLRPLDVVLISKSSGGRVMVNNHIFNPN